jgi:hypothetical protein
MITVPQDAPEADAVLQRVVCAPCAWREAAVAAGGTPAVDVAP